MSTETKTNSNINVRVDYEKTVTAYASQFVLQVSDEEVTIDCSPGLLINNDGSGRLPVHTRLVLSQAAARNLGEMLREATARQAARDTHSSHESALQARFPQLNFNTPRSQVPNHS